MKKYTYLFLKIRLLVISVTATLFFLLDFFVLLFDKNAAYPPISAFWVYVPALIWYGLDILLTVRFERLIRYQEKCFNIVFSDENATPLFPSSSTFLSDHWLIFSGKSAFYRQYIKKIKIKTKRANGGNDYYLEIQTCDGKTYTKNPGSYTDAKKIRQWFVNP